MDKEEIDDPAIVGGRGERQAPAATHDKKSKCKYFLASLPLLLALLIYHAPFIIDEYAAYYGYGHAPSYELPPGVMDAFRNYDQNGDGCIDPYEFAPLGLMVREEVSL